MHLGKCLLVLFMHGRNEKNVCSISRKVFSQFISSFSIQLRSVIGAVLILLSVLVTTLRKLVMELPEDSPAKTRFRFLLK